MKTNNYEFISDLFNKSEKINEEAKNRQVNAYKVSIVGNTALIESIYLAELGTNDVRTIALSKKQLDRLQKLGDEFFVYGED